MTGNVYISPGVTLYYKDGLRNPGPSFTLGSCGGSCPDVYAFDGSTYQFETDMGLYGNMAIPRGDGFLVQPQGFDYHVLDTTLAKNEEGRYEIALVEDAREVNYLDKVRLYAVELPEGAGLQEANLYPFSSYDEMGVPEATHVVDTNGAKAVKVSLVGMDGEMKEDVSADLATAKDGKHVYVGSENPDDPQPGAALEIDLGSGIDGSDSSRCVLIYRGLTIFPISKEANKTHEVLAGRRVDGRTHTLQVFNGTSWIAVSDFKMGGFPAFYRTMACTYMYTYRYWFTSPSVFFFH
jgi:hypothetical protein